MSDIVLNFSMKHQGPPITRTLVLSTLLFIITTAEPYHEITSDYISKFVFENGTVRLCQPILPPYFCGAGHHIIPCVKDGDMDQCVLCPAGQINLDRSYSDFIIPCYTEDCPEGTVPAKKRSLSCNLPCRCDESAGYSGKDACSCYLVNFNCGENTYLKDGVCQACEAGKYKSGLGYGPCLQRPEIDTSPRIKEAVTSTTMVPESISITKGHNKPTHAVEKYVPGQDKDTDLKVKPDVTSSDNPHSTNTTTGNQPWILPAVLTIVALILVIIVTVSAVLIIRNGGKSQVNINSRRMSLQSTEDSRPFTGTMNGPDTMADTESTFPSFNPPTLNSTDSSQTTLLTENADVDKTDPKVLDFRQPQLGFRDTPDSVTVQ